MDLAGFIAEGIHKDDHGLKGGCTKLTTLREIELPKFSIKQQIKFAILYAKKSYDSVSDININFVDMNNLIKWINKEGKINNEICRY